MKATEIIELAKEEGVSYAGKKSDIIKRIIAKRRETSTPVSQDQESSATLDSAEIDALLSVPSKDMIMEESPRKEKKSTLVERVRRQEGTQSATKEVRSGRGATPARRSKSPILEAAARHAKAAPASAPRPSREDKKTGTPAPVRQKTLVEKVVKASAMREVSSARKGTPRVKEVVGSSSTSKLGGKSQLGRTIEEFEAELEMNEDEGESSADLNTLTARQLIEIANKEGVSSKGKKTELIRRINQKRGIVSEDIDEADSEAEKAKEWAAPTASAPPSTTFFCCIDRTVKDSEDRGRLVLKGGIVYVLDLVNNREHPLRMPVAEEVGTLPEGLEDNVVCRDCINVNRSMGLFHLNSKPAGPFAIHPKVLMSSAVPVGNDTLGEQDREAKQQDENTVVEKVVTEAEPDLMAVDATPDETLVEKAKDVLPETTVEEVEEKEDGSPLLENQEEAAAVPEETSAADMEVVDEPVVQEVEVVKETIVQEVEVKESIAPEVEAKESVVATSTTEEVVDTPAVTLEDETSLKVSAATSEDVVEAEVPAALNSTVETVVEEMDESGEIGADEVKMQATAVVTPDEDTGVTEDQGLLGSAPAAEATNFNEASPFVEELVRMEEEQAVLSTGEVDLMEVEQPAVIDSTGADGMEQPFEPAEDGEEALEGYFAGDSASIESNDAKDHDYDYGNSADSQDDEQSDMHAMASSSEATNAILDAASHVGDVLRADVAHGNSESSKYRPVVPPSRIPLPGSHQSQKQAHRPSVKPSPATALLERRTVARMQTAKSSEKRKSIVAEHRRMSVVRNEEIVGSGSESEGSGTDGSGDTISARRSSVSSSLGSPGRNLPASPRDRKARGEVLLTDPRLLPGAVPVDEKGRVGSRRGSYVPKEDPAFVEKLEEVLAQAQEGLPLVPKELVRRSPPPL
ncbi:hypothetical protein HDU76_009813 [Blyttiomyces sp. JEL0837]|nr:hypothetical protein HDU76_009813 [Blyttiomyces sp. JEL0837]